MMIPGIQDFYDHINQHMDHEIEHTIQNPHPQLTSHHDSVVPDPHDALDAHADHSLGGVQHEESHLIDLLIPSALQGIVTGAVKFAAEMATDAILTHGLLASVHPHGHDNHHLQVGSIEGDGFIHQTTGFTCAVVSQQMILHQFHLVDPQTGEPISESKLVYDATANGWLTEHGGTSIENLGKLLDHYGVPNHDGHHWPELLQDLAAGHQVIMAVNADNLWSEHSQFSDLMNFFGNHPNHAIVVKGLHVNDHGQVMVVVNDPGQADGAGVEYPLNHFQSAVDSLHMHYVATDHAPPDWNPANEIRALAIHDAPEFSHHPSATPDTFSTTLSEMTEIERNNFLRDL